MVEDDADLAEIVALGLRNEHYAVDVARTCAEAEELFRTTEFDAAYLDLGLPDGNGLDLLRRLPLDPTLHRPHRVIIVTARDDVADRVAGLDAGADDYLTKPFAYAELVARVRALGRRDDGGAALVRVGDVSVDLAALRAWRAGRELSLTPLAGRAVLPIERIRSVTADIEGPDSGRLAMDRGPTEIVALAASFDAMLDRLERVASQQQQLIDEASHELRTPLAVLRANAEVLLGHPAPTLETYRAGMERTRGAALRLQATIDELLVDARSRARSIDGRPTDLMTVVGSVVDDARILGAADGIAISIEGPQVLECNLDEPMIVRALSNLLANAVAHSPPSSSIEVTVGADEVEASVAVVDHGSGIRPEDHAHIFERSWRGSASDGGTGLGLAIAKQIALAHGGALEVSSPGPGGDGAAFELRLCRVRRVPSSGT